MAENKILVTDLIAEVSNQALALLTSEELIRWVLEKAPLAIEHDASAIILFDDMAATCYLRKAAAISDHFISDFQNKAFDAFRFETKSLVSREQCVFTIWSAQEAMGEVSLSGEGLASFYCTPLVVRKKILGVFAISSTKPDFFLVYRLNMFNVFASQVALAIDSLSAREQVVKQARIIERDSINMKNTFAGMSEGLIMTDEQDKIVLLNPMARKMLGLKTSAEDIPKDFIVPILGPLFQGLVGKEKRFVSQELEFDKPYPMTVRLDATLAKDSQGRKIGVVVLMRDVTREKEIDRMKTEFISIVSHELRTPLTTIRESVSQVLDGILGATTGEQREFLSICLEDIDRLTRIINDLLDISKIEAKKVELKKSIVDIAGLARSVNLFFYPRAREKGLDMETNAPLEAIEVYIDRDKIIQVFNNLIGNALKFTTKGHIELTVKEAPEAIECSVADTGRGIAAEDLPKVFSKFEQFGRTDGPGEKGTGLGLAIAKGIVEIHMGKMWLESTQNEGTSFFFLLPKYVSEAMITEIIERKNADAKRDSKEFSLFRIGLENFHQLQQELSDKKAYSVLLRIVEATKKIIKGADFLTPEGNIFIINDGRRETAQDSLGRLKSSFTESAFTFENKVIPVQCSFSYTVYPQEL